MESMETSPTYIYGQLVNLNADVARCQFADTGCPGLTNGA